MVDPAVQSKVKAPAIALIVLAALGEAASLVGLASSALNKAMFGDVMQQMREQGEEIPPFLEAMLSGSSTLGLLLAIFNLCLWPIVAFGAIRMMQLRSRGLCLAAAVAAMVPTQCCCFLGIGFGIWALVVLNRDDVRAAFGES